VAPTGEVMTRIVMELVGRGHEADVVTALPWYQHHGVEPGWEGRLVRTESTDWGSISRVHPFPTDKTNIPARALAFGGFTAVATAVSVARRQAIDGVLAMSPPLTMGISGWLAALRHQAPMVFNIQDVFPDVAIELGVLRAPSVIRLARWLERFSYLRADAVTVLSDDLAENVRAKVGPRRADRVRVIPNFVDTEQIAPSDRENSYRREFGLSGKQVVMYAGNVGFSQSLDLVLDAAAALAHDDDVRFVINGGGSARAELQQRARGLDNVLFVDMQPKERLPEVLAAADIHLVPLKQGLARSSVPSKLYSILAAGRPVVASVDRATEVARTIEKAGAGLAVEPDQPEAFTKAVARLLHDPDGAKAMGRSGRRYVEGWASPAAVAESYELLFTELRGG
jgi:colanic acid biosynthesis glycosyl transferase WcaI